MNSLRILHVDDEPDIREVVDMSLGLDPDVELRSCSSGRDALMAVGDWPPDLVLLDVMMPDMDGPTTLRCMRDESNFEQTPVVFMTARAQPRELELFVSLGAAGVIAKPFDPMTLAPTVRAYITPATAGIASLRGNFMRRARNDGVALAPLRAALLPDSHSNPAIEHIRSVAHSLAGAGGIFGYPGISNSADRLARTADAALQGLAAPRDIMRALDDLLRLIESD